MTTKTNPTLATFTQLPTAVLPRFLALLTLLALLSGCRQPPTEAPTDANVSGTYTLVSVDNKEVPASVSHGNTALQVKSGTFVINNDGTCSSVVVFVPPSGTEVSKEVKATYTVDDSTLTMQWEGAGTTTGTVDGESFTMNNEGMIFSYRRSAQN